MALAADYEEEKTMCTHGKLLPKIVIVLTIRVKIEIVKR